MGTFIYGIAIAIIAGATLLIWAVMSPLKDLH